jgi:hypothetical protein
MEQATMQSDRFPGSLAYKGELDASEKKAVFRSLAIAFGAIALTIGGVLAVNLPLQLHQEAAAPQSQQAVGEPTPIVTAQDSSVRVSSHAHP